jgi:hypothetical protein
LFLVAVHSLCIISLLNKLLWGFCLTVLGFKKKLDGKSKAYLGTLISSHGLLLDKQGDKGIDNRARQLSTPEAR